jgi:hypothetical protein
VIELTFKGENIRELYLAMEKFLVDVVEDAPRARKQAAAAPSEVVAKPEKKPEPKPDTAERMAKVRAAKLAKNKAPEPTDLSVIPKGAKPARMYQPPPSDPRSSDEAAIEAENAKIEAMEPDPFDEPEPEPDPVNLAALRVKTTEDLQAAYSSGKHKQVLALLSKYGNGARSFRELQIQDFVPIRKAIDDGALA